MSKYLTSLLVRSVTAMLTHHVRRQVECERLDQKASIKINAVQIDYAVDKLGRLTRDRIPCSYRVSAFVSRPVPKGDMRGKRMEFTFRYLGNAG